MKPFFLLSTLLLMVTACNNDNTKGTTTQTDTTQHSGHTMEAGTSGNSGMKAMHDAMNNMMTRMKTMQPTGDADHDFAMMMKHHHQSAVDMAKIEVANGQDRQLKSLAEKMITDQQKEISQLDAFLQNHQPSGKSDYGKQAMGMMTEMNQMNMEGGSLDAMFASMMIPHHEDAVKMSEAYLKVAQNDTLKAIARNILTTQPKEVDALHNWLTAHKNTK